MEEINLNKTVYSKGTCSKIIDTSFSQLGVKTIQEQVDAQDTTDSFFSMYNDLFYIM